MSSLKIDIFLLSFIWSFIKQVVISLPLKQMRRMLQEALRHEVRNTSQIANVGIYVEQAIGRLKQFRISKNVLPIKHLYLCDDIVTVVYMGGRHHQKYKHVK